MFKKTVIASLAAVTLVAVAAASSPAQAKTPWGAIGVGVAAGALIASAAASHSYYNGYYGGPTYVVGPGYRECRRVPRFDAWGNYVRSVRVCYD